MLTIYKASAGSGKTFTLALVYIKSLLGIKIQGTDSYRLNHPKYTAEKKQISNRHRNILAITFTNKATDEMKRRIVDELSALASVPLPGEKDTAYGPTLCADFGCSRTELAQVAATALRQLLYDYQSFNVTTIDSFFQRVLRSFARELDRQGDFNIELNDKAAVQISVGTMIDDFNKDASALPNLSSWIYNYMLALLNEGAKNNFFNRQANVHTTLVETVTKICEEKFKPFASQMREFLKAPERLVKLRMALKEMRKAQLSTVCKLTAELRRQWEEHGVSTDQINGRYNIKKYIENELFNGIEIPKKSFFDSDTIIGYIEGKSPFTKKFKGTDADLSLLANFLLQAKCAYRMMYTIDAICKSLDQLGLLANAWQYIDRFSSENNTVLLSDTNHLLEKVIGNESTPFIYEKMGLQLHHFLIDEFQDTSKMQWNNLKPLLANSLAEDYDSLIIGDEKQSIYRFRNSDSSLLHTQVGQVDFPRDSITRGDKPGENTNYRSSAVVVNFNNALFTALARETQVEGFENVVQEIAPHKADTPGYVMFMEIPVPKKGSADDSNPKAAEIALKAMENNMRRQHAAGGYAWSDIAVLVEKNSQAAQTVNYLLAAGIPVASDEALYLVKSPAVQLIVGILKILANYPSAEASIKRLEDGSGKKRFATPAQLSMVMSRLEYFRSSGMEIEQAIEAAAKYLDQDTAADSISVGVEAVRSRKPSSLLSIVETVIKEQIPEDMKKSQVAYLAAFQDFVAEYCSRYNPTLKAFISAWEETKSKLTIASGADVDAVTVMTIHKSKGLEFPCVHIPFCSWQMFGNKDSSLWVKFPDLGLPKEDCPPAIFLQLSSLYDSPESPFYEAYSIERHQCLVDTMNKTYVAFTRAGVELMAYYYPTVGLGEYLNELFSANSLPQCRISCRDFILDDATPSDASDDDSSDIKVFEIGEPTKKAQKKEETEEESDKKGAKLPGKLQLDEYLTYYHDGAKNVITCVADTLDLDSDIAEADAIPPAEDPADYHDEEARLRGVMLHDTLSLIEHRSDIDFAIKLMVKSKKLSSDHADELKGLIEDMLYADDPHIKRWFESEATVLNEQTVYLSDDDMNKRLDRLMIYSDGSVEIIDYKFTSETEMKLRTRSHRKQVSTYINALKAMGYTNVKGYLWYPLQKEIVNVDS